MFECLHHIVILVGDTATASCVGCHRGWPCRPCDDDALKLRTFENDGDLIWLNWIISPQTGALEIDQIDYLVSRFELLVVHRIRLITLRFVH